jgi:transposase
MEINSKEKRINIILDNARIHHAKIVEKACEILNINLIFLKPYCPDLIQLKMYGVKLNLKYINQCMKI